MHPDIGILLTYIKLNRLSMIPDGLNTLTFQYSGTNNAPGNQVLAPLHGILPVSRTYYGYVYSPMHIRRSLDRHNHTAA